MTKPFFLLIAFLLIFSNANAQIEVLKNQIESLIKTKNAKIGVSIIANNFRDTIAVNADVHLPMQSVYKFPIALAVLSEIDKGKFSLKQKLSITENDLRLTSWSPLRDKYPKGAKLSIAEIIKYTVAQSDNNGCDILLRLIGGADVVQNFLNKNKITEIQIQSTEEEMQKEWEIQYQNWATANSLNKLLTVFFTNSTSVLTKKSHHFIWNVMKETSTGVHRLKGELPSKTIVAHKTGSSGVKNGVTGATNDIGVIFLPNKSIIFISVLVADSSENAQTNEKIIADIAKLTWDFYKK